MEAAPPRVDVGAFSGTLSELLSAVDAGSVDAASLPLREVLAQVRAAPADLEDAAAAFVTLAHLVERKARALLPTPPPLEAEPEEASAEAQEQALAERMAAYEAFAEAAEALRVFERQRGTQFGRPAAGAGAPTAAEVRAARLSSQRASSGPGDLERLLAVFADVWERARPRTREVQRERWGVAVTAERLRRRLAAEGSVEFADLFAPDADRLQVVVTFLAILEMVRRGEVSVHQQGPFAPLRIEYVPPEAAPVDR